MSGISGNVERMTQAHLRNVQQLAVFYTGNNNIYAINITKVKAFIITEEVIINDTPTDTDVIAGIATIRGEPITIINLDKWLGLPALPTKDYQLIVFCEFNNKRIGFLIKSMLDIVEKTTDELRHTEEQNSKITYTTYVHVGNGDELCSVFNAEQLLRDIGWTDDGESSISSYVTQPIHTDKIILAAEDSGVAREVLIKFFKAAHLKYEVYNNGEGLLKRLNDSEVNDIGLVITDIEMPEVDGFQVAQFMKSGAFAHVPVIVNSSMTTAAVKNKMSKIGVDAFVSKADIESLYFTVKKFLATD